MKSRGSAEEGGAGAQPQTKHRKYFIELNSISGSEEECDEGPRRTITGENSTQINTLINS